MSLAEVRAMTSGEFLAFNRYRDEYLGAIEKARRG